MADTPEPQRKPLTGKRHAFVAAYLGPSRLNATDAARRAGYAKPMEEGYRLLRNVQIQAEITAWRERVKAEGIAILEYRVNQLNTLLAGCEQVLAERSEAATTKLDSQWDKPLSGERTGLVTSRQIGVGRNAIREEVFDDTIIRTITTLHQRAAKELGQEVDKREIDPSDDFLNALKAFGRGAPDS